MTPANIDVIHTDNGEGSDTKPLFRVPEEGGGLLKGSEGRKGP